MIRKAKSARRKRRPVLQTPYAVLAIAIAFTLSATLYLKSTIEEGDRQRFETIADQAVDNIHRRMDEHLSLLTHTAGLLSVRPDLTLDEFREFVQRADLEKNYGGVRGLGYAVKVPKGDEAWITQFAHSQGLTRFDINPKDWNGDVFAILYLEPMDEINPRALGYNMYSEARRREAMDAAADSGQPVATAPVQLIQFPDDAARNSFLVYVPVYKGPLPPPQERRKKLLGYAYSPFKGADLLGAVARTLPAAVRLEIYDTVNGEDTLLTSSPNPQKNYAPRYRVPRSFEFGDRFWRIVVTSTPQFDSASERSILPFVAFVGVLASVLLFVLSLGQQLARMEAEQNAEKVRQVADAQQFLAQAGAILAASIDYEETLRKVSQLAVPRLADWCSVSILNDDGALELVALAHADPEKTQWGEMLSKKYKNAAAKSASMTVLKTGKPVLLGEVSDADLRSASESEEQLELMRQLGICSALVVPLIARGKATGTITMVSTDPQKPYDQEDVAFAEQLAIRAGLAVDNSRLFRDAQQEVAERQRAEGEVRTLNAELEQRVEERTRDLRVSNAELEAFSYSVSHDLRAPLRSVSAFASILREELGSKLDEENRDHLNRLDKAARRMGQLIDSLLQYSRLARREIRTEKVDATALAEAIAGELRERYPERDVEVRIQPGMCTEADPVLLRVVYENLMENAFKFTTHRSPGIVEVGRESQGEMAFYVRDNGAGFDEQYANKLFRPFERLHKDSEFPGTGIGLANVRRVIERHGGRAWAEGKVDQGATIFFTLPGAC